MSLLLFSLVVVYYWFDVAVQLDVWRENNSNITFYSLVIACVCYGVLLMFPFMPAFELGVVIMTMYGVDGVVGAYLATVIALMVSFFLGAFFIKNNTVERFKKLPKHIHKLNENGLLSKILCRSLKALKTRPYLSLALLLNLPGNAMLGGGGGIAMMAGASGTMKFYKYFLTLLVATSIIPVLILFGMLP